MKKYILIETAGDVFTKAINASTFEEAVEIGTLKKSVLSEHDQKRYTFEVAEYNVEEAMKMAIEDGMADSEEEARELFNVADGQDILWFADSVTRCETV